MAKLVHTTASAHNWTRVSDVISWFTTHLNYTHSHRINMIPGESNLYSKSGFSR